MYNENLDFVISEVGGQIRYKYRVQPTVIPVILSFIIDFCQNPELYFWSPHILAVSSTASTKKLDKIHFNSF